MDAVETVFCTGIGLTAKGLLTPSPISLSFTGIFLRRIGKEKRQIEIYKITPRTV